MQDQSYILILGHMIGKFHTKDNEEILSFNSMMGPNGVPYPYAQSDKNYYFPINLKLCPIPQNLEEYPYFWFCDQSYETRQSYEGFDCEL
jgi:hypothetical protein